MSTFCPPAVAGGFIEREDRLRLHRLFSRVSVDSGLTSASCILRPDTSPPSSLSGTPPAPRVLVASRVHTPHARSKWLLAEPSLHPIRLGMAVQLCDPHERHSSFHGRISHVHHHARHWVVFRVAPEDLLDEDTFLCVPVDNVLLPLITRLRRALTYPFLTRGPLPHSPSPLSLLALPLSTAPSPSAASSATLMPPPYPAVAFAVTRPCAASLTSYWSND